VPAKRQVLEYRLLTGCAAWDSRSSDRKRALNLGRLELSLGALPMPVDVACHLER
jgi:hypothetical protein